MPGGISGFNTGFGPWLCDVIGPRIPSFPHPVGFRLNPLVTLRGPGPPKRRAWRGW